MTQTNLTKYSEWWFSLFCNGPSFQILESSSSRCLLTYFCPFVVNKWKMPRWPFPHIFCCTILPFFFSILSESIKFQNFNIKAYTDDGHRLNSEMCLPRLNFGTIPRLQRASTAPATISQHTVSLKFFQKILGILVREWHWVFLT